MLLRFFDCRLDALSRPRRDDNCTGFASCDEYPLDGFRPSVRRKSEETPVHRQHHGAAHASMGLHGLFRAEMPVGPRLVVLADLDHREIERAESIANGSQTRKKAGVARVVNSMACADERVAGPQLRAVIEK